METRMASALAADTVDLVDDDQVHPALLDAASIEELAPAERIVRPTWLRMR